MHPILHRVIDAYRPLAGRNRLVEGVHVLAAAQPALPRRLAVFVLVAGWRGRRP